MSVQRIQEHVWARYVNYETPSVALDEDSALEFLEAHYAQHPMTSDPECYYYGILAFERSFADTARQRPLLERALKSFEAYRGQENTDSSWDTVDDRYAETLNVLGLAPEATL